jgi:hypothetical protein
MHSTKILLGPFRRPEPASKAVYNLKSFIFLQSGTSQPKFRSHISPPSVGLNCKAKKELTWRKQACWSKTPVSFHQTMQRDIPEYMTLHSNSCFNLKSNVHNLPKILLDTYRPLIPATYLALSISTWLKCCTMFHETFAP